MKRVLITGASGKLGFLLLESLTKLEYFVRGVDIHSFDSRVDILDITNEDQVKSYFDNYQFDILINNAGIGVFTPMLQRTVDEFMSVTNVNLLGTFLMTKHFIINYKNHNDDQFGRVINIASIYAHISSNPNIYGDSGRNNSEVYSMTKAGVIAFTKYCAANFVQKNIIFNSVSPGGIYNSQSDFFIKEYSKRVPAGRLANIEEIVEVITFLTHSNKYLNGSDIIVDGALSKW
jgi:NAD(P)-dependent dehydrogenase (short-subunit alcohol dehydrogenase family)